GAVTVGVRGSPSGGPLEVDAASVLLPVAVSHRIEAFASADFGRRDGSLGRRFWRWLGNVPVRGFAYHLGLHNRPSLSLHADAGQAAALVRPPRTRRRDPGRPRRACLCARAVHERLAPAGRRSVAVEWLVEPEGTRACAVQSEEHTS